MSSAYDPYEITFPALPAHAGRAFAGTWWGNAWLRALEDSALDGEQVRQGRRYARTGAVGAVSVRPGGLTAVVRDRDGTAHRTDVLVQEFTEAEWDRVLGLAAAESGYIAALLDCEVPPELAEEAAAAGVDLLPGLGELDPRCDCGEWDHCPHTAALCYQVARLLDQDPFVLLLLRGRAERDLVDELERRSAARAQPETESAAAADPGVAAAEVFAAGRSLPPLPAPPEPPAAAGQPPTLDTGTEPDGLDVDAVEFLAQAAAFEAHRLLAEALAPGHASRAVRPPLTAAEDAVRLTAQAGDFRVRSRLAGASGRDRAATERAVRAWGFGGAPALAVLDEDWTPDPAALARARSALAAAWPDEEAPALRRTRARWTAPDGERQLRLARDGRWWPLRREAGRWTLAGPPSPDPASALAALTPEDTGTDAP
ncbi:SWF or SNF family helicase [Streptomyces sp. NBC_00249]|uniref:SWIM zinc finger family protein n=1 Tax=Streptomyces sp. NBC_00249 TaxID=2975690 RepID=UPI0022560702|nr:SWF or SNF family helicase [Streptomyces sp. NBC_00249]MCX5197339.1 SWF or SNF family helicase [Streptomyces sp. NBC_00249]